MTLRHAHANVIPLRKSDDRQSEVRDLLRQTRIERLRVAIESGNYTIDPDKIADQVIEDIIL